MHIIALNTNLYLGKTFTMIMNSSLLTTKKYELYENQFLKKIEVI